nr:unnamed protein product [Callosobruchus analis]
MHQLLTSNWRFEISSHAADTLNLNKWNNITIVPLASDLKLMRDHLLTLADKSIKSLCIDNKDASAFNILVETIYCDNKGQYEEFESIVTPSERILLNKFKRVVIRGKRNRGVPVLFSDDNSKKTKNLNNQQQRGRKKRLLIPWTEEQKRLATTHFAKHIRIPNRLGNMNATS